MSLLLTAEESGGGSESQADTSQSENAPEEDVDSGVVLLFADSTPTDDRSMCGLTELVSSCLTSAHGHFDKASTSLGNGDAINNGNNEQIDEKRTNPFLHCSLFTNVPPTVRFYTKGIKVTRPSKKIVSKLMWCHNSLLPIVMRQSLLASHFKIVEDSDFWIGYWGRHLKSADYKNIKPYQKVNHFPGAFHIGRKDRLWTHVSAQIEIWDEEYRILPVTYIIPRELEALQNYLTQNPSAHVIIKPPASARGTGITVTRKIKDIKENTPFIAQHYINRPLTINSAKFDLRLYAYIPSFEPLRVYLYEEGLVRFASLPYSQCLSSISNRYMHLTNYSINKLAEKDGVLKSPVPKWRLTELWRYFEDRGQDSKKILRDIESVIVKTFIACEKPIRDHMVKQIHTGFVCHELFGVDILLDEEARPWLLEVNISPSLHSGTTLDSSVKAPLAKDVLNMAGIFVPPDDFLTSSVHLTRPRNWPKSSRQLAKEAEVEAAYAGEGAPSGRVTTKLTAEDTKMLVEFEDELRRAGDFRLLFPTVDTVPYLKYFIAPVYANLLLSRWQIEQAADRSKGIDRLEELCREGLVLQDTRNDGDASTDEEPGSESDTEEDEEGDCLEGDS